LVFYFFPSIFCFFHHMVVLAAIACYIIT
jgi:hypothetical protein